MSIEALNWAMDEGEKRELPSNLRFVLIMLGNSANEHGGHLFPSYAYIGGRTGLDRSTVRRHIATLETLGLLIKSTRIRELDGSQTSNDYRLAMAVDNSVDNMGAETGGGRQIEHGGGVNRALGVGELSTHDSGDLDSSLSKRAQSNKTALPPAFAASEAVMAWARKKSIEPDYVASCLEAFTTDAQANARRYANWDAAFMNWIRREPSFSGRGGAPTSAPRSSVKCCAYCTAAATGSVGGIDHCREHTYDAMDRKAVPAPA